MNDDPRHDDAVEPEDEAWRRMVIELGGTEEQARTSAPKDQHDQPVGPRDYTPADEPENFTPADPPALTSGNPRMVLIWVAAIGSPIGLVLLMLSAPQAPFWVRAGLVVTFLLGLAGLFFAVPTSRTRAEQPPDDSDYGGGARI